MNTIKLLIKIFKDEFGGLGITRSSICSAIKFNQQLRQQLSKPVIESILRARARAIDIPGEEVIPRTELPTPKPVEPGKALIPVEKPITPPATLKTPVLSVPAQPETPIVAPATIGPVFTGKPQPTGEGQKPPGMQIFRMDEPATVMNVLGKQVTLPKGEEYRTYDLGNGKIRLQDGKQITVYEGELSKLKGKLLPLGEQPMAGGREFKYELTKDEVSPDLLSQIFKSEQEYIQKIIIEGKSPAQVAKELGEDITDTTKGLKFAIDHYREVEQEFAQGMEKAGTEEEIAKQKELKDYLRGKLKLGLTLKGEYSSLKHLPWLFAQNGEYAILSSRK